MSSLNRVQQPAASEQISGFSSFFNTFGRSLARLGGLRAGVSAAYEVVAAQPSEALAGTIEANSNMELDWLWAATTLQRVPERRYCLRRALEINPDSEMALRELSRIGG